MQAVGVCKGQPCLLVSRFLYRHAHSTKLRTSLLYRTASSGLRFRKLKPQPPNVLLQVSSSLEEDTHQNNAGTKVVKVKFVLQRRCEFGQQFNVTGDEKLFGAWDPEAAIPMQWSEGHIWTAELDLSAGTCVEFKVIRMAEQEVLEWQPGQNRKLELSGALSSLVVFVHWSDEEYKFENDAEVDVEINEFLGTPDDVTEEQTIEETSTDNRTIKANDKDFLDEWQPESKEIVTGDQEAIDGGTNLNAELKPLKPAKVLLPFAIPDSWYGEEETSDLSSSRDSIESSPVAVEDIANGENMSSAFSDAKEEEDGEKLVLVNRPDKVSEGKASFMILTPEFEPITKEKKDEELRLHDVPVEVTSQRNVGTLLSDTELKDTNEESSEKHRVQNSPVEVISETSSETMSSTTVSNNQNHTDKEAMCNNEPIAKVPENEMPSTGSLENVETKPSMTAKEKRWGHKGWSKLWGTFVHGRKID